MKRPAISTTAILVILRILPAAAAAEPSQSDDPRLTEYHARRHQWPPSDEEFQPNTEGWRQLHRRRFRQLQQMDATTDADLDANWDGWNVAIHSALTCQNFTQYGWGLTRAPQDVVDALRRTFHKGLVFNPPQEEAFKGDPDDETISLFVDIGPEMRNDTLDTIQPILEAWSNVDLIGEMAYGLRVYRNGAHLGMHVDRSTTHVISAILHVDHDPMGDPWPLVIESFDGSTNEIFLEAGDMLLYESSKLLHGRPIPFDGVYYTSLFLHYRPMGWDGDKVIEDMYYRIPPSWDEIEPRSDDADALVISSSLGKFLLEPDCEHHWCTLPKSKKWRGPVEEGYVISVGGIERLNIKEDEEDDQRAGEEL